MLLLILERCANVHSLLTAVVRAEGEDCAEDAEVSGGRAHSQSYMNDKILCFQFLVQVLVFPKLR